MTVSGTWFWNAIQRAPSKSITSFSDCNSNPASVVSQKFLYPWAKRGHTVGGMPSAPASALDVSKADRQELSVLTGSRAVPQGIAMRARIVLGAADGVANKVLARQLSTSVPTVLLWRRRFEEEGLIGILEDRPRPGRPKQISVDEEAALD